MRKLILMFLLLASPAYAVECPSEMKTCRVWFLSPEVETLLIQPNGILATAAQARMLDFGAATQFLRNQIDKAPHGDVAPKGQDRVPESKP